MNEPDDDVDLDEWWPGDDAPPAPRRLSTGRVLVALAPLVALAGVLLIVAGSVVLDHSPYGAAAGYPRVGYAQGSRVIAFHRTGTYLGYVETGAHDPPAGSLTIVPITDSARVGAVRRYTGDVSYETSGRHGTARWTFRIERAGTFQVVARNASLPAGASLAFGHVGRTGLLLGVLLVLPGALLVTVAFGLVLLGVLLRRRHRRSV